MGGHRMSDVALGAYPQQFPGCQMSCLPELWDCRMASSSLKKILNRHRSTATNIVSRLSYLGKGKATIPPIRNPCKVFSVMASNGISWTKTHSVGYTCLGSTSAPNSHRRYGIQNNSACCTALPTSMVAILTRLFPLRILSSAECSVAVRDEDADSNGLRG